MADEDQIEERAIQEFFSYLQRKPYLIIQLLARDPYEANEFNYNCYLLFFFFINAIYEDIRRKLKHPTPEGPLLRSPPSNVKKTMPLSQSEEPHVHLKAIINDITEPNIGMHILLHMQEFRDLIPGSYSINENNITDMERDLKELLNNEISTFTLPGANQPDEFNPEWTSISTRCLRCSKPLSPS